MSDLRQVLERAQEDYDFFLAVLADPESALRDYSLDDAEREALSGDRAGLWRIVGGQVAPADAIDHVLVLRN